MKVRLRVGWRVGWRMRVKAEVSRSPSLAGRQGPHPDSPHTDIQVPGACAEVTELPAVRELGFLVEFTLLVS